MMLLALQRVVTAFLVPPGVFILILFASVLLLSRRSRRLAVGAGVIGGLLWVMSTAPLADRLMRPLEMHAAANPPSAASFDVIVLLGGGIRDGVPDLTGSGAPGEDMQARILTAVRLQRRLQCPIVVAGGAPPEFSTPEAVVVRRFLVDLGVPEALIFLEDRSRDTLENARNVAVILRDKDFGKPLLVTSAYHVQRARLAFAKAGVKVDAVGAGFRVALVRNYSWANLLPSAGALASVATACREYIGLTYYRLVLGVSE